jgi:hypothetical protein
MKADNKRLFAAAVLLQALSFLLMSFAAHGKDQTAAGKFRTLSAVSCIAGIFLLWRNAENELKRRKIRAMQDSGDEDDVLLMYGVDDADCSVES